MIYVSSELGRPTEWGSPVLCDFGSAVLGSVEHTEDVQPNIYRAPEVILEAPWGYSVDVWNVGCMVSRSALLFLCIDLRKPKFDRLTMSNQIAQIWDLFEGESLFSGLDGHENAYRSRAHLAEMVSLLGPPPPNLLARATASSRFFSKDGESQRDQNTNRTPELGRKSCRTSLTTP